MKMLLLGILTLTSLTSLADSKIKLQKESVNIANIIKSSQVIACIDEVEKNNHGIFKIKEIHLAKISTNDSYLLKGWIVSGDIILKNNLNLTIKESHDPEFGSSFECETIEIK